WIHFGCLGLQAEGHQLRQLAGNGLNKESLCCRIHLYLQEALGAMPQQTLTSSSLQATVEVDLPHHYDSQVLPTRTIGQLGANWECSLRLADRGWIPLDHHFLVHARRPPPQGRRGRLLYHRGTDLRFWVWRSLSEQCSTSVRADGRGSKTEQDLIAANSAGLARAPAPDAPDR
ncbi:uncharacterized protein BO72DRAFT_504923, partial [Aspergillus fijiensis CBS 313.89]